MVKIKKLVSIHKHSETWMLTKNLHPERLVWDEREVRDGWLFFTPFSWDTGVSEELPVREHSFEFDRHIGRRIFRVTAGQADGKAKKKTVSLSWS